MAYRGCTSRRRTDHRLPLTSAPGLKADPLAERSHRLVSGTSACWSGAGPTSRGCAYSTPAGYCGKSSWMSCQDALEATWTCNSGRTPGSSSNKASGTPRLSGVSLNTEINLLPQLLQKPRCVVGELWNQLISSSPAFQEKFCACTPTRDLYAAACAFLQMEQWQFRATPSGPVTENRTFPQRQLPRAETVCPCSLLIPKHSGVLRDPPNGHKGSKTDASSDSGSES